MNEVDRVDIVTYNAKYKRGLTQLLLALILDKRYPDTNQIITSAQIARLELECLENTNSLIKNKTNLELAILNNKVVGLVDYKISTFGVGRLDNGRLHTSEVGTLLEVKNILSLLSPSFERIFTILLFHSIAAGYANGCRRILVDSTTSNTAILVSNGFNPVQNIGGTNYAVKILD
jgi:hypothetical protein